MNKKYLVGLSVMCQMAWAAPNVMTVTTMFPTETSIPYTVPIQGPAVNEIQSMIKPEQSGLMVVSLLKNIGDTVKKGEVLAVLDARTLQLEQQKALALEKESKIAWEKARSEYTRASALPVGETVSVEVLKNYEFAERSARARYESSMASRQQVDDSLRKTTMRAPFDGVVQDRTMNIGSLSTSNEGFTIVSASKEWRPLLNGQYAMLLKKGLTVQWGPETLKVKAWSPALNANRQVLLRTTASSTMVPGYLYSGSVVLGTDKGLSVPRSSVLMKDKLYAVMTVENGRVKRIPVTVLDRGGSTLFVKGVTSKAHVIIKGMNFVNHGDSVKEVLQ